MQAQASLYTSSATRVSDLSQVSRTAVLTLICRAVETERNPAGFRDPMAVLCLERLVSAASDEDRQWILREKRIFQGIQAHHVGAAIRRVKAFDRAANQFIADHPHCTVVNLACGFDTRFWRIDQERCAYIEIDLPGVIALKQILLVDHLNYEMVGASVLEPAWIDRATALGNTGFLLLAEGLFMFLSPQDSAQLLKEFGERFAESQLVLDVVPEKYITGIWKYFMRLESRITWGLDVEWVSGIRDPHDIEACASGLEVVAQEKGSAGPILTVSINARGRAQQTKGTGPPGDDAHVRKAGPELARR